MKSRLNFIDLFSGAGGFSCGLEMAGLNCLLGVDFNKDAIETFKVNHPKSDTFCGDISKLTNKKISDLLNGKKVNLVVGGPPCQGFSTVGIGNPKDQRNTLFKEFLRIVKHLSPEYVVMENVTGIIAKKNEHSLKSIFQIFRKMGYQIEVKILSAHEYGVPEKRKRAIFIGTKRKITIDFPKKTHGDNKKPYATVGDAFSNLNSISGDIHNHDLKLASIKDDLDRKRLKYIPEGMGVRYEKDELKYLPPRLRYKLDWSKLPEKRFRQTKLQRLSRQLPGPTIMTHRTGYYHPTENRLITAREAASIQSFPGDFIFTGSVTSQWRQIGNAVPPLLSFAIGKAIKKMEKQTPSKQSRVKIDTLLEKALEERKNAFKYNF